MSENSPNFCPKCRAPIPPEAPQGLCPKCVLAGAADSGEASMAHATATGEIPSIERIAAAFPQLEIVELIGRGGMGFVFKARQPHLDRFVALKLLPDKMAKDPQFAERFNREGRVLAKLNHPNIVGVFDFGQAGGFYYLLMEYVDGVNLRQAMRAGRFSPMEALGIVPGICEALQYAHDQGVLHRDIKPENILLDARGRVKIADFGIAKLVGEDAPSITLTGTGSALGTPHYMAPEQLEKPNLVDHRADIYSLGVVFYEMLTGELPIGRFAPPSARTPIDDRVDRIVLRALEKERELRQKNAGEFKTEVERVVADPQMPGPNKPFTPPASPVPPVRWWHHVVRGLIGGAAVFLLVLLSTLAITLFLPKTYEAQARLGFTKQTPASDPQWVMGTGPDGLRATAVLSNAAAELDLNKRWSSKYKSSLTDERVIQLMRSVVDVRQVRSTRLYEVRAVSDDPQEAAEIANAIASAFCSAQNEAQLVEIAEIPADAVRPNVPLNAAIGAGVGIMLGALGAIMFGLQSWRRWSLEANALKNVGPGGTVVIDKRLAARVAANRSFSPWHIVPRWITAGVIVVGIAVGFAAWSRTRTSHSTTAHDIPQLARETVELLTISPYASDAQPWRPDGQLSREGWFDDPATRLQPGPGERAYHFFFRIKAPPGSSSPKFVIENATGWSGTSQPKHSGKPVNNAYLITANFPPDLKRTRIKAGVAVDPWESLFQVPAQSQSTENRSYMGQRLKVQFLAAVEDRKTNTVVNVLHNVRDFDFRLVAVDSAGLEVPALLSESTRDHISATFVGVPLAGIREFRFQVRPYRWVEFKRVALQAAPTRVARHTNEPIRLRFRVPKGEVATFQVMRMDVEPPALVESLQGYFAAADDERARGEFVLAPAPGATNDRTAWRIHLNAEDGPKVAGGSVDLGDLLSSIQPPPNNFWEIRPGSDFGIQLTHQYPLGIDKSSIAARPELRLIVTSQPYSNVVTDPIDAVAASAGTTNWMRSLRELSLRPRAQVDTSTWVRFTFTNVELRNEAGERWLSVEYVADARDAIPAPFRWEQNISGFTGKTRSSDYLVPAKEGAAEARYYRTEFSMPAFISDADLEQFVESLRKATVTYSVLAHGGQKEAVFKFPVADRGTLAGWVAAQKPAETSSWVRFTFTAVEIRNDDKGRWLAIDYSAHENGDVVRTYRLEQNVAGFTGTTRRSEFVVPSKDGAPEVRHQRVEFLMPPVLTDRDLRKLRDELAKTVVRKSIVAHAGEEKAVFKFPVDRRSAMAGFVGAMASSTNQ